MLTRQCFKEQSVGVENVGAQWHEDWTVEIQVYLNLLCVVESERVNKAARLFEEKSHMLAFRKVYLESRGMPIPEVTWEVNSVNVTKQVHDT